MSTLFSMARAKKPTNQDAHDASIRGLRAGLSDNAEVTEEIASDGKVRISHGKVGQKQSVSGKLSSFNEFDEKEVVSKKTYRRPDELPFPELGSQAEANRPKKQIPLRFDPDLIEQMDAAAEAAGLNRQTWVTLQIERALGIEPDPEADHLPSADAE